MLVVGTQKARTGPYKKGNYGVVNEFSFGKTADYYNADHFGQRWALFQQR